MPHNVDQRNPAISVNNLRVGFGAATVLDGLNLVVEQGEVMAVVGGSGTGKSVLLNTIIGLTRSWSGGIEIFGKDIRHITAKERARMRTRWGVLFQHAALFSSLSVAENVDVPLRENTGLSRELRREIVRLKIEMAGLPADAEAKFPAELSGGMLKRAGLARALALDPDILFLDEPTAGLDPVGAASFDLLIGELRRTLGLTVLMVTHDLDSLYALADRAAILVEGRAIVGTVDELERHSNPVLRAYFHGPRARAAAAG
jgi:phospholipid/cholesterol/gamma-HCH transport system ATP-binding protein